MSPFVAASISAIEITWGNEQIVKRVLLHGDSPAITHWSICCGSDIDSWHWYAHDQSPGSCAHAPSPYITYLPIIKIEIVCSKFSPSPRTRAKATPTTRISMKYICVCILLYPIFYIMKLLSFFHVISPSQHQNSSPAHRTIGKKTSRDDVGHAWVF